MIYPTKIAAVQTEVDKIDAVDTVVDFIKDVTEGDAEIDTGATPWQLVITKKGTATELVRKDLKDKDGNNITGISTVIGQHKEP